MLWQCYDVLDKRGNNIIFCKNYKRFVSQKFCRKGEYSVQEFYDHKCGRYIKILSHKTIYHILIDPIIAKY